MERKIIKTGDGSVTIHLPEWNEQYHSKHGAIQEARHVFLKMGLNFLAETSAIKDISILEIGFGTGLNAYLTFLEARKYSLNIDYTGIEAYPVPMDEVKLLNYPEMIGDSADPEIFYGMHKLPWERIERVSSDFNLKKEKKKFNEITNKNEFDLIYFDAFGARVQPELWTEEIFKKMFNSLKDKGVLVTYAAKGSVRRAMLASGFEVEKLPGPPGKREMLRAVKK